MARIQVTAGLRGALILAALLVSVTGCGRGQTLADAYDEENRIPALLTSAESSRAAAFADELCVASAENDEEPEITGAAGGVFDLSGGTAPYQKNVFEKMNPASTTKVLTALLALKYGNPDDIVTVTEAAKIDEPGSSMAGIVPGDQIRLEDLLYGLLIPSGNDAANAIAVYLSGSVEAFAQKMNEEAARIGATGSHFTNANGLTDPEHYLTAYDLYLIFREALTYDKFRDIIGTKSYTASYTGPDGEKKEMTWTSGSYYFNGKEEAPDGLTVFGGKTGTTQAAGYCLVLGSRTEDGREYASVIMDSDSRDALYAEMTGLMSEIPAAVTADKSE